MLDFDQAQTLLANAAGPLQRHEDIGLNDAAGRVLAADLTATVDIPPADNSAMDGYALRVADWRAGGRLPIQQRCYAGDVPEPLKPGHAIRLFTGSLLPDGADTVVMQEDTVEADNQVEITRQPAPNQHIRRRGEDTMTGTPLLPAGTVLQAAHVALLASQGLARVSVVAQLRVGILTTGDELVACGRPRAPHQIYNSNAPMLAALVSGTGAEVAMSLHAADTAPAVDRALRDLHAGCDLVICVGGASVGDKDLLRPALDALGASFIVAGVRMKPGKPVALARLDTQPMVLLPGNPGAATTAFALFVAPLIRRLQGRNARMPIVPSLPIDADFEPDPQRERFVRVHCTVGLDGTPALDTLRQQGAGTLQSLVQASGLARLPAGQRIACGDAVPYYEFAHWLA